VVVDDARSGVTDVVRGADLLASAVRQELLYEDLGHLAPPRWWHVPLVRRRARPAAREAQRRPRALASCRARGVDPRAVVAWCARTAGLGEDRTRHRGRELAPRFDLRKVPATPPSAVLPARAADWPRSAGSRPTFDSDWRRAPRWKRADERCELPWRRRPCSSAASSVGRAFERLARRLGDVSDAGGDLGRAARPRRRRCGLISLVVAVCSSTAAAMVAWIWWICWMIAITSLMAVRAPPGVALDGCDALRDLGRGAAGLAGQVLDLVGDHGEAAPSSPARAASMVAFSASRLVCAAIEVISLITAPTWSLEAASWSKALVVNAGLLDRLRCDRAQPRQRCSRSRGCWSTSLRPRRRRSARCG
jgi:hypothetical protein